MTRSYSAPPPTGPAESHAARSVLASDAPGFGSRCAVSSCASPRLPAPGAYPTVPSAARTARRPRSLPRPAATPRGRALAHLPRLRRPGASHGGAAVGHAQDGSGPGGALLPASLQPTAAGPGGEDRSSRPDPGRRREGRAAQQIGLGGVGPPGKSGRCRRCMVVHSVAMDLVVVDIAATPAERAAIDAVLDPVVGPVRGGWDGGERDVEKDGRVARGGAEARSHRDMLLPAFHAAQDAAGWISPGALAHICRRLTVPPAEAYGVASFYALLSTAPKPRAVAHVCDDIACRLAGAEDAVRGPGARRSARPATRGGGRDLARAARAWASASRPPPPCSPSPATRPSGFPDGPVDAARVIRPPRRRSPRARDRTGLAGPLDTVASPERLAALRRFVPQAGDHGLRLLARSAASTRPASRLPRQRRLSRPQGGDRRRPRPRTIEEVITAEVLGRGGAAFPAGQKWAAARASTGLHPSHRLQRGRGGARDVQGPRDPGGGPVRAGRGDDHRVVRGGRGARIPLPPRRVPTGRGADAERHRPGPRARPAGPGRDGRQLRLRHRDPARRWRVHLRRGHRALRVHRGQARRAAQQGRPVHDGRACSRSPRSSTTWRRWSTSRPSSSMAARSTPRWAPPRSKGHKLFSVSGHVARPGVYEVRVRASRSAT